MRIPQTFLWMATLALSHSAFAAIGQPEKSIDADVRSLQGVRQVSARGQVRVHEIHTDGQSVREYVTPDGTVFAVTWNGLGEPDLSQLFGSFYNEYEQANKSTATPAGRLPKKVQSDNLVVFKSGHMRHVIGKAYNPKLVPSGFNLKDLQ